ncbi:MAG: DPP IV N-terminal domain-containing protein [Planctomycetota bacterium]
MVRPLLGLILFVSVAAAESPQPKIQAVAPATALTIERIYDSKDFKPDARSWTWDARRNVLWHIAKQGNDETPSLVEVTPNDGRETVVLSPDRLTPDSRQKPLSIRSFTWSSDEQFLLVFTNTKRVWRTNSRGDYWLWDRSQGIWRQLGAGAKSQSLMFATFSPDGASVAYVATIDNATGLFVEDVASAEITPIAVSDDANTIHGTFDWVYEEELGLRRGFAFSPDSRRVAFWQLNAQDVRKQTLIDNTSERYAQTKSFAYPKVGEINSAAKIGIYDRVTGSITWAKIDGDPRQHYLAALHWPDKTCSFASDVILVQQLNRYQNQLKLIAVDVASGLSNTLWMENSDGWILHQPSLHWHAPSDGRQPRLLWLTERRGWRQLEVIDFASDDPMSVSSRRTLTPAQFDVIELLAVDDQRGRVYFTASPDDPTRRALFHVDIDGGGWKRVSPEGRGTYAYKFSHDARWALETWSGRMTPVRQRIVRPSPYSVERTLVENELLKQELAGLSDVPLCFTRLPIATDDGSRVDLDAYIMGDVSENSGPPASKPLLVHVYGEPYGQTVTDRWGGTNDLWHRYLCENGFVVVSVDNRGTNSPRGVEFRQSIYGKVGVITPMDQAAAVGELLRRYPVLDPERVGVWGWSGGGSSTLNGLFRYPELYAAGVSVAPVSDQRDYDTIYQERYMGSLSENEEAYIEGSPITHAQNLDDPLLIIHGTGDDNVHYSSTTRLMNKLIAEGKSFQMMAYPGRTHSISEGKGTTLHLRRLMTDFLMTHLLKSTP